MGRIEPTTDWSTRTKLDYLIQESLGKLLLEDNSGALLLQRSVNTFWSKRTKPTTPWN